MTSFVKIGCVLGLFIMAMVPRAFALEDMLYYDGSPLMVHVSVGRVTEIVFPKKVARLIKGGEADSVLIEVMDHSVFILPKESTVPDVFVTNENGENYPLHLIVGPEHQSKVKVVTAFGQEARDKGRSQALDLMKVLLLGRIPNQATVRASQEKSFMAQGSIELTLNNIVELPTMKALLLTARNLTDQRVMLPLESIAYPGLLAVASDADSLSAQGEPESETKVYMVIRP